jgi:guanylate kinase
MENSKRIILVGKGGSGKDYARKLLEDAGFRYCVSHTTRPPREGEINGKDYYFISKDAAAHQFAAKDLFYEYVIFNGWVYGTTKDEFVKSNLFIMTPSGISKIKPSDRVESFIVYFDIDEETRRNRLLSRRDADNVERRIEADEKDFENFNDFDHRINDPNFGMNDINIRNFKIITLEH